jgi:hypothetical protein
MVLIGVETLLGRLRRLMDASAPPRFFGAGLLGDLGGYIHGKMKGLELRGSEEIARLVGERGLEIKQ